MKKKLAIFVLSQFLLAGWADAQQAYFIDGYHGGIYGHYPVGQTAFIAQKLRQNPNWNINIEIEPESWEVVRQRDPEGYEAFKRLFKDQSVESGRIEYVNPTYAQSYFFGTSGESAIRQFEYGIRLIRKHFPEAVFTTYSAEEPCFTSCLPYILKSFGFSYASTKNPNTMWGGYVSAYGGELVNWVGPDGTRLTTVPRYACEDLQPGSCWQSISWFNTEDYIHKCLDAGIQHPVGMCIQDASWSHGWDKGPWLGQDTIQPIYYYWPNTGTRRELSRQFDVIYNTLEYNSDKKEYTSKQETAVIEGNLFGKSIPAPWCDTEICVKGDYFARHFGKEVTLCIDEYQAAAVDAHIDTLLIEQEAPNMNTTKSGYCAPATVQFSAIANTPTAALFNWKIYRQGEEDNPVVRFTGEEVDYTFNQSGTFIIKLEVSDQSTTCSTEDEVQIDISESYLMIPNAFSPGTTPGINDEFRVAYKSLVKFKAWIFNRWGLQMYYWTDPAQGWDGKKGGKYVQPGVYFYVIEAEGSDGIKYKEKGDINILRPKTIQDENENIQE